MYSDFDGARILPMSGIPVAGSTFQPLARCDLAAKEVVIEFASYDVSIADFFAIKTEQYPNLDIYATQGLTTDMFNIECAKYTANQYEPELVSIPQVESHDKECFNQLKSAQLMCHWQEEKGWTMVYDSR